MTAFVPVVTYLPHVRQTTTSFLITPHINVSKRQPENLIWHILDVSGPSNTRK